MTCPVILASTSTYRAQLLRRLLPRFSCCAPGVAETMIADEPPAQRALRLARLKAHAVADDQPDALIIGSDQVAALDRQILGKPGNPERAREQLAACSDQVVHFHTAVCVLDTRTSPHCAHEHVDLTRVHFRRLHADAIARYVEREQPLDCAGSFKCEGLGISLFQRIENSDPSALIGLPLIAVARMLRECGIELP